MCDEHIIRKRIKSANSGIRSDDLDQLVNRALDRNKYCCKLSTVKIDTSKLNKDEVLNDVLNIIRK
jgi:hypothetical protein